MASLIYLVYGLLRSSTGLLACKPVVTYSSCGHTLYLIVVNPLPTQLDASTGVFPAHGYLHQLISVVRVDRLLPSGICSCTDRVAIREVGRSATIPITRT